MLYIAKQEREGYLTDESLQNFSCSALKAIDEKWYNYPEKPRHFGFRVQKQIWQEVGSPNPDSDGEQWITFWRRVGWMDEEKNWITYSRLGGFVSVDTSNLGNLPYRVSVDTSNLGETSLICLWWCGIDQIFFSRAASCNL
jgi:hypothetical protein